jgi:hypothetical protein
MQNFIIFCSLKFNLASKQLANDLQAALHKRNCNLLLIKRKRKRKKKVKLHITHILYSSIESNPCISTW